MSVGNTLKVKLLHLKDGTWEQQQLLSATKKPREKPPKINCQNHEANWNTLIF